MAVLVKIPAALQKLTRQQSEVHAEGGTVQDVLADLERCFPGMQAQLCDDQGAIYPRLQEGSHKALLRSPWPL